MRSVLRTKMDVQKSETCRIFVALVGEGVDVWRPVEAVHEHEDRYRILSENHDPEDERWEFQQGAVVRCRLRNFADGTRALAAFERVGTQQ